MDALFDPSLLFISDTDWKQAVTQRPSSTRIHYVLDDKKLIFRQFYGEGEHDDGL